MLECQQEVLKVRASKKPLKLSKIFQKNRQLLYKFLVVLKHKFGLTKRFGSIFHKFDKLNKFCSALHTRNLVEHAWLCKPDITVDVNYANKAPILNVSLNKCSTNAILDTGSTYSLVPYTVWQTLGLNKNQLDQSVRFNINSASHNNPDAVLGQITLTISVKSKHGVEQILLQNCLILRPHLDLSFVLLGNDFLTKNSVNISYNTSSAQPMISINTQEVALLSTTLSENSYFISSCLALPKQVGHPSQTKSNLYLSPHLH